jgi:hypothetical protein
VCSHTISRIFYTHAGPKKRIKPHGHEHCNAEGTLRSTPTYVWAWRLVCLVPCSAKVWNLDTTIKFNTLGFEALSCHPLPAQRMFTERDFHSVLSLARVAVVAAVAMIVLPCAHLSCLNRIRLGK